MNKWKSGRVEVGVVFLHKTEKDDLDANRENHVLLIVRTRACLQINQTVEQMFPRENTD